MQNVLQDLRYALRQLRKAPGFASTAILILALGVGGTTTIFSALNPILFEPLPYPHAGRILMIWYTGDDGTRAPQAFHTYREVAERNRSFESLAVMKPWQPTMIGGDQPERLDGQQVSAGYFRTLGVIPFRGRDFQASDDIFHGPKVVILSYGLWRRRFASDPAIIDRQVRLDDESYTVIGVTPPNFENVLSPDAEAWSPLQYDPANIVSTATREWGHHLRMIGRLRDGITVAQATSDLGFIASTPVAEFPRPIWATLAHGFLAAPLQDDVTRGVKPALLAVFGAVILVLFIACVNVTNLVLARGARRQGEVSIRAALGAAPRRLIRQLVTESLLLGLLGGVLGMLVTQAGVRLLVALSPSGLPRINAIRVDGAVFAFALAISILLGIVIGVIPAWHASRKPPQEVLQRSSYRTGGQHEGTRRFFVVAEVALALVLLVSAGLLLHSLRRLLSVPPGFEGAGVLSMQVEIYGRHFDDDRVRHRFFEQALDAVRRVPGVNQAAFTSQLPLSGDADLYGAHFEGDAAEVAYSAFRYAVTPGYFETLKIPLRRGRFLDEHDTTNAPPVMVISESLAKRRFPNQDPRGKLVHVGGVADSPPYTIVGVVGDVKQLSLALNDSSAVYTTTTQWHWADETLSLIVRTHGDPANFVPTIKNAIWAVDNQEPIVRVALLDDLLATSAAERRFILILFEVFGLVALTMAATGIYGVLSGSVAQRTREIGVRSALGATRASIVTLVLRQGITLAAIGLLLGLIGAVAATQAIAAMLFEVSPLDPFTYFGVILLLGAVSAIACGVPAWRAARVDPVVALRYE